MYKTVNGVIMKKVRLWAMTVIQWSKGLKYVWKYSRQSGYSVEVGRYITCSPNVLDYNYTFPCHAGWDIEELKIYTTGQCQVTYFYSSSEPLHGQMI